jgi:hypothetical protein
MYQPKIKDALIRNLYFLAQREGKKMTHVLNEVLEEYLIAEPEPPPYEPQWIRYRPSPDAAKRKERAIQRMMREYHGGANDHVHRSGGVPEGTGNGQEPHRAEDCPPHEPVPFCPTCETETSAEPDAKIITCTNGDQLIEIENSSS